MEIMMVYIGREEFVGRTATEVASHYGIKNVTGIQICGDRGSEMGYEVGSQYVIRIGDAAILFECKNIQAKSERKRKG